MTYTISNPELGFEQNYFVIQYGFVAQRFEMQSAPNWAKFKA